MKDVPRDILESGRPERPALELVNFCLERLFEDSTHSVGDTVARHLTYEELLGALIQARRELRQHNDA